MAILVKPVQRVNPNDAEAPKKWYVTQLRTRWREAKLAARRLQTINQHF